MTMLKTIDDILKKFNVTSYKNFGAYTAIRKGGFWVYFKWYGDKKGYLQSGSTQYLQK